MINVSQPISFSKSQFQNSRIQEFKTFLERSQKVFAPSQHQKKQKNRKYFYFFFYFFIFVEGRLEKKIEKQNFGVWGVLAWLGLGWPGLGWTGWIFKILFFYFFFEPTLGKQKKIEKKIEIISIFLFFLMMAWPGLVSISICVSILLNQFSLCSCFLMFGKRQRLWAKVTASPTGWRTPTLYSVRSVIPVLHFENPFK